MGLPGITALDDHLRGGWRRGVGPLAGLHRREALKELVERAIDRDHVRVADQEGPAQLARPAPCPEVEHLYAPKGAEALLGAEGRAAQRVLAEGGAVDQLVGVRGGLIVGSGDFLD